MTEKVVLGLSDGVDSAVAAKILLDRGYEVHALYLDIAGEQGRRDAESSAERLGIPLTVEDISGELEKHVCAPFARAYLEGRTPNPCLVCNPMVKLPALLRRADAIGAKWVATGHYAVCDGKSIYAGNPDQDQSYMLCRLRDEQIARLLLPLGAYEKPQVRKIALELGLTVADKPDSRENCFIKGMTYAEWIESRGEKPAEGPALLYGKEIGRHGGVHRYTVGQRWPDLIGERRLYVSRIDAAARTLELVLWEDLFRREFDITDVNWIGGIPDAPLRASVRVRHTRWEMPMCAVTPASTGAHVVADEPFRAPATGQTAALYDGTRLLGGGFINGR